MAQLDPLHISQLLNEKLDGLIVGAFPLLVDKQSWECDFLEDGNSASATQAPSCSPSIRAGPMRMTRLEVVGQLGDGSWFRVRIATAIYSHRQTHCRVLLSFVKALLTFSRKRLDIAEMGGVELGYNGLVFF